ncbi:fructosamine kinase family protein [Thermomonospora umbrina]|uniref:Fructosamine-3-kinase n=1 Tax=Thermomonospora umbrina TaxID=111806 RepID=A0A3D9STU2_9ACTN|nr:fructosamine kinase family protein [Thermomonospora umbrina]REE97910.1 fructosamine-3-kinase [Thermomonospora umbrina]
MVPAGLERLLGVPVERVARVGSGHAWTLFRGTLADGREVFVKAADPGTAPDDEAGVFAAEAAGLRWLGEGDGGAGSGGRSDGGSGAGRQGGGGRGGASGGAPVPEVLGADESLLVLPWLPSEAPSREAAERFGRELAVLHAAGAESFGAPWQGYIAHLPLDNTRAGDWPRWYAERRIAPYLRRAARHLGDADVRLIERVMDRIEELGGPAEPPARIHGDLWSGNVVWSGGRAWLVDPAAHGGHRETDLAMLDLFGAPYLDRVMAAYQEIWPLADGWRARVPLHRLHPLLVHVVLYGGSYRSAAVDAARAALRVSW